VNRGHEKVEAYIPRFRRGISDQRCPSINPEILDELYDKGYLKYTPSQCYDDVFIIKAALHYDGVIVSNDQYRDVMKDNPDYGPKIPER
jgi:ribonuclease ZC3H12